jgi:release factor glutamine methyltransferase
MHIAQALVQAHQAGVERLDAQLLLAHLLHQTRAWLLAHDDADLTPEQRTKWAQQLQRRAQGEPLAYVLGETEFCGLRLHVTPATLIPRPETELLVQWAQSCLALRPEPAPNVIDLGTGSGAIALALKQRCPHSALLATDTSAAALAVARGNAQRLGLALHLAQGAWWQAAGQQRFALAVANPPYVAAGDPHLAALSHEPLSALTPGMTDAQGTPSADGLADLQTLIVGASPHLLPGAWLLLEHGHDQADALHTLLLANGFEAPQTRTDLAGLPRCTGARWPGP